ncbi:MAG TPA: TIGR03032 family protein [Allosphingosinicella sp.]|jgi:uncharacterized protein (TIGR03032 family)
MPSDSSRFLQPVAADDAAGPPRITLSRGIAAWLLEQQVSLAFTSYQTGRLIVAGVGPDGRMSFNEQNYARAMGLHADGDSLYIASLFQIWRLRNMLRPGEYANRAYDRVFVPRLAHTTGYVDAHDLGVETSGRIVFVSSLYSCLATVDDTYSFRPLWKPSFITDLAPEDRCHLNGMALSAGRPRYLTALGSSNRPGGWREQRGQGGVLIDAIEGGIVADRLSMPHSPRMFGKDVLVLESGRGNITRIDPATGGRETVAFCPGYLRGMAILGNFAVVGLSKPRESGFGELALQAELDRLGVAPWCGLAIVDLVKGTIVEFIRYESQISELFDVALLAGVRNPVTIGPATEELLSTVRPNPEYAPLLE